MVGELFDYNLPIFQEIATAIFWHVQIICEQMLSQRQQKGFNLGCTGLHSCPILIFLINGRFVFLGDGRSEKTIVGWPFCGIWPDCQYVPYWEDQETGCNGNSWVSSRRTLAPLFRWAFGMFWLIIKCSGRIQCDSEVIFFLPASKLKAYARDWALSCIVVNAGRRVNDNLDRSPSGKVPWSFQKLQVCSAGECIYPSTSD